MSSSRKYAITLILIELVPNWLYIFQTNNHAPSLNILGTNNNFFFIKDWSNKKDYNIP